MAVTTSADASGPAAPASLPAAQRIAVLDVLRGFALMGILIMNMPSFSASMFAEADGSLLWPGAVDHAAEQLRDLLFSGKFNGIFSLLFGLGFTLQFERLLQADPARAPRIYLRRLLVLMALGVFHACVLWTGDILHWYALLGLLMVFGLRHLSDRGIAWLIVATLLYPTLAGAIRIAWMTPETVAAQVAQAQALHEASVAAYGHGSFVDAMALNSRIMAWYYGDAWNLFGGFGGLVMIATTMLLGMLAGRRRWAQRIDELMPVIRRATGWTLLLGLLMGAGFTLIFELNRTPGPSFVKMLGGLLYRVSRLALMLFYILAIVRLSRHPAFERPFALLAAAGRMPLTNYLAQTLICTALFNHWGLGWWGRMGPAAGLALSLAIFWLLQVPASLWWLKRHDSGPLEELWARLTYGRRRPAAVRGLSSAG